MTSRRQPLAKSKPLPPAPNIVAKRGGLPSLPKSQPISVSPNAGRTNYISKPVYNLSKPQPNKSIRVTSTSPHSANSVPYFEPSTFSQPSQPPARSYQAPRTRYIGSSGDKMSIVRSWARNQDVLDIYMVNAFYTGTNQRMQYPLAFWKTATCFGLQTAGVVLLMSNTYKDLNAGTQNATCNPVFDSFAWIAFLFSLYISLFCVQSIKSLNQYGMYAWGKDQPKFVNKCWVAVGFVTNFIVLTLSWFCSVIIIYVSPNLLELVLNSLAVQFLISLDDEIIGSYDYDTIGNWIDDHYSGWAPQSCVNCVFDKAGNCLFSILCLWEKRVSCNFLTSSVGGACNGLQFHNILLLDILLYPFLFLLPFLVLICFDRNPYYVAIV